MKGYVGEMKRTAREVDDVLARWVKKHRERRLKGSIEEEEQDFIHVMLSTVEDAEISADEVDFIIKATCSVSSRISSNSFLTDILNI